MLSVRKINPMARAIGTIGAVAALVAGITYAATISTNTVTLSNNTLSSATTTLGIAGDTACEPAVLTTSVPGMNFNNLIPNTASSQFPFCVDNTGNTPLAVTLGTPSSFKDSAIKPADVTLNIACGVGGATTGTVGFSSTVAALETPVAFDNDLNNGTNNILSCEATATLDSNVTASNASLNPFDLNFVGTSINP